MPAKLTAFLKCCPLATLTALTSHLITAFASEVCACLLASKFCLALSTFHEQQRSAEVRDVGSSSSPAGFIRPQHLQAESVDRKHFDSGQSSEWGQNSHKRRYLTTFVACSSAGVEHPAHTVTRDQMRYSPCIWKIFNRITLYGRTNQAQCLRKAITDFLHNLNFWLCRMFKI